MFEFIPELQEQDLNLKQINEAIKELKKLEVLVGIPEEKSSRNSNDINNAELLFIHTNGSPVRNIPARPALEPAINDDKEIIADMLKKASMEALEGNIQGMKQTLEKTGMRGQNVARAWFTNPKNNWASLKELSVKRREEKMSSAKLEESKSKGRSHKPLIDTGELRKSITYVVRNKK